MGLWVKLLSVLLPEITEAENWGPRRGPRNIFLFPGGEEEIQRKSRR